MDAWLARLKHDLLKRALWPARDLLELISEGKTPSPRDRKALRDGLFALQDDQGAPCEARFLFAKLRESAPKSIDAGALDSFAAGVDSAMNVVGHAVPASGEANASDAILKDAAEAVLALEQQFEQLAKG